MKPTMKLNIKWALPALIAIILVGGLFAALSTGLFKGTPAAAMPDADEAGAALGYGPGASFGSAPRQPQPAAGGGVQPSDTSSPAPAATGSDDEQVRRPLNRAELAQLLADAFALAPSNIVMFNDVQGHAAQEAIAAVTSAGIMDGWFDGTFRPRQVVTRAEVAVAVVRALGLEETAAAHPHEEPVFRDVPVHHHAYAAVSMAHRLGLYPFHVGSFFAPDEPVELAEARHFIKSAAELEQMEAPVAHVNAPARTVSVQQDERRTVAFTTSDSTLIVRNGAAVSGEQLHPGDVVHVYADEGGHLLVAIANGPEHETTVVSEASRLLRELATPEQLSAIIARDWDRARSELQTSLYNQLVEAGATPEEATALLQQDWHTVEQHGKERLTELVSERAEVEPELVRAVLDQDWETAMSHLEAEVLEYVLNYLMATDPTYGSAA